MLWTPDMGNTRENVFDNANTKKVNARSSKVKATIETITDHFYLAFILYYTFH